MAVDQAFLAPHVQRLRRLLSPRERMLQLLRASWGRAGDKDGVLASRYFELTRDPTGRHVDDRTWVDLELPKIFAEIDSTVTPIGSQWLFKRLHTYGEDGAELVRRYVVYDLLRRDRSLREAIQLKLAYLNDGASDGIADHLFGEMPSKPRHHRLVLAWSVLSLVSLVLVLAFSLTPWLWLPFVAVNAIVFHVGGLRISRDADVFRACGRMLRTADGLAQIADARVPELVALGDQRKQRARLRKAFRWFTLSQDSLLIGSLMVWLNLLFLGELVAYIRTLERFARLRHEFQPTFESLGSLDAAVALASFLERRPRHCRPVLARDLRIEIVDGYHPLIEVPTTNSVRLDRRSALVTGSNMAGKTTFIKMIGANVVLGCTTGVCLASSAVIPASGVMASIRGEHSVESGKSHYFAEIEAVLAFLRAAERGECALFVIDELFSGTNTLERIAAARAVLESLSERAQVIVTTHDVELQALLAERFELFHFREAPELESLFDYRLRPGATMARNAIRLLERFGFPATIVTAALRYAGEHGGEGPAPEPGPSPLLGEGPSRSRDEAARERDGRSGAAEPTTRELT